MSPTMKRLNNSLPVDIRLFSYDLKVNEAWAEELLEAGILSSEELNSIKDVLHKLSKYHQADALQGLPDDEDVHTLVERRLTEFLGETGKKIHTGRSRNDQVVTDFMLCLKDECADLSKKLETLILAIIDQAEANLDTIMPGYTHLQKAQPILLSHYLMSFAYTIHNDLLRVKNFATANLSKCPLGSGAISGTTLNIDRERLAKRLGFAEPTENSLQSTSDRAFAVEFASVLAIISMHFSRYAEDLIIYNSSEFGFVRFSDNVTTGSSMMPQKKNPDSLELIRGLTGTVYGNLMALLTITKGVPLSYVKDLQDDKRLLFSSIDLIYSATTLFTEVISGAEFYAERMLADIDKSMFASDLADVLVSKGLSFRTAYDEVANLVRVASAMDRTIDDLTEKDIAGISSHIKIADISSLTPKISVEKRNVKGGTSTDSVKTQIAELKKMIRP